MRKIQPTELERYRPLTEKDIHGRTDPTNKSNYAALAKGKMQKIEDSKGGKKINIFRKTLIQKTKQYVQAWTKRLIQTINDSKGGIKTNNQ